MLVDGIRETGTTKDLMSVSHCFVLHLHISHLHLRSSIAQFLMIFAHVMEVGRACAYGVCVWCVYMMCVYCA